MNASTSLQISGSTGAAKTLSEILKAGNGTLCLPSGLTESGGVHLCSINKALSKKGQGLLLTAAQEWRSVYDKGSTSPRCLKILSYILGDWSLTASSSCRRCSSEGKCPFLFMDVVVLEFSSVCNLYNRLYSDCFSMRNINSRLCKGKHTVVFLLKQ